MEPGGGERKAETVGRTEREERDERETLKRTARV